MVERKIDFAAPADRIWSIVGDVPAAAACLPGLAVGAALDARSFKAEMSVAVGPIALLYAGRLTLVEVDAAGRRVRFAVDGVALGGLTLAVRIAVAVVASGAAASRLAIVNEIGLDFATTLMAGPMIASTGGALLDGFARNLRGLVEPSGLEPTP